MHPHGRIRQVEGGFPAPVHGAGHGIPSHDAFSDLFNALDPDETGLVLVRLAKSWAERLAAEGSSGSEGVIAIDGKTLRRSFEDASERSPLHLVNAFATEARPVLGQVAADGKSNEVTAVTALPDLLDVRDRTVTLDAMHAQRSTAETVTDRGGRCVVALKGSQGTLHADVKPCMEDALNVETILFSGPRPEKGHGRFETRAAAARHDVGWLAEHRWSGLAAIGSVTATRETKGKVGTETGCCLMSERLDPDGLISATRTHRGIENSLHWVLDVTMNEDRLRNRTGHGPENLSALRKIALNMVRAAPDKETKSMRGRFKEAGWDDRYLLWLFTHAGLLPESMFQTR